MRLEKLMKQAKAEHDRELKLKKDAELRRKQIEKIQEEERFRYRQARNIIQANRKPVEHHTLPRIETWNSSTETVTAATLPMSSSRENPNLLIQPPDDQEVVLDELYEKFLKKKNPNFQAAKEFLQNEPAAETEVNLEACKLPVGTLQDLDQLQLAAMNDVRKFQKEQEELRMKLEKQQRLMAELEEDIKQREQVVNFVFKK